MKWNFKEVLVVGLVLFLLSTLIYKNSVCCMFSSTRSFGFPGQFLTINKTTDSFDEAKKVEYMNNLYLLKNGWQLRFTASIESLISISARVNIVVNVLFWLAVGWILVFLKNIYRKK